MLAGAGHFFHGTARQIKTLVDRGVQAIAGPSLSDLVTGTTPVQQDYAQNAADAAQDAPLMATKAGMGGNLGAGVLSTLAVPGSTLAKAMLGGAAIGELTNPAQSDADLAINPAVGGLAGGAGYGIGKVLGRILGGAPGMDGPQAAQVANAQNAGMTVLPGTASNSPGLQLFESWMKKVPGSSGVMAKIGEHNQEVSNEIMSNSIGQSGAPTPAVLADAQNSIGNALDAFKTGTTPIKFGPSFLQQMQGITDDQAKLLPHLRDPAIANIVAQATPGGPNVPFSVMPDVVQMNRSQLSKSAADAFASHNSDEGQAYQSIVKGIDDAVQNSLPADQSAAYALARKRWGNWLTLTRIADPSGQGNISPMKLATVLKSNNPTSAATSQTDPLINLSRIAQSMKDLVPNSGTEPREQMANLFEKMAGLGGVGGLLGAGNAEEGNKTEGTALGVIGGIAAPYVAAKLYTQPLVTKLIGTGLTPGLMSHLPPQVAQMLLRMARTGGAMLPGATLGSLAAPADQ
jgi:hypothetical protein